MAVLSFKVQADYEKVVKLREEIAKLETQMRSFGKNTPLSEIKQVETKLAEAKSQFTSLSTEAARAGAVMGNDFKGKIHAATQEVNRLSQEIIDQKAVVKDTEFNVKRLGDAYRRASKNGSGNAGALGEEFEAAKKALEEDKAALFGLTQEQQKAKLSVKKLKEEYAEFKDEAKDTAEENGFLSDSFKKLAKNVAAVFTIQKAGEFANQVAQVRGEFQKLEVAFETMLQSKEKSDDLMAQIVDTAAKTPFDLQGVASGAKQLLAYGVASEKVNDTLIRLGDIASGLSIPLGDLVYLYGTTMAQGRMFTMDLRQFQGRGIPMAEELAKVMGVTKSQVSELVTAGKVGFKEMEQAIVNMTSSGGKFSGLMEKQSKTITGQISNLQDAVDQMFNEIGRSQEGLISGTISTISKLVENYEKVGKIIGGLVVSYGAYKAAVISLNALSKARVAYLAAEAIAQSASVLSMSKVTTATVLWQRAQERLNLALMKNPYVLAGIAVAGLAVSIYALVTAKSKEERAYERVNKQMEKYNEELDKQKQKMGELLNVISDPSSTDMQRALAMEELRKQYPALLKGLSDEQLLKLSVAEATKMLNEENDRLKRNDLMSQIDEATQKYEEYQNKVRWYEQQFGKAAWTQSGYQEARTSMETYRLDLKALLSEYTKLENAAQKAEFLALPADQKIVSLENSNKELDNQIAELDKKLAGLHARKQNAADEEPQELPTFTLGQLGGAMWNQGESEEEILAEMKRLQNLREQNNKDIAANQAKIDANNQALSAKQKQANYNRQKAEEKAKKDLEKSIRDLNDKVAQAEIDSMEEGYAKTLKQLELNRKKENDAILDQRERLKETKKNEALQEWLAEDSERKAYDFKYTPEFTKEEEEHFKNLGAFAQQKFNEGRADAVKKWEKEGKFILDQYNIDAMVDGADKDKAQRELNNEKEIHQLEMQKDAYIEAARAVHILAEERKKASDPNYKPVDFDETKAGQDFNAIVEKNKERQRKEQADAERKAEQDYLIEYGSYKEKVLAITEQYADKISKASTEGEKKSLKAERDKILKQLEQGQNKAYQNIFKDPTKMSLSSVKSAIALAREEIKKITDKGVMNEDDINNVKILQEALDKLTDYATSAPFAGFGDGLDGVVSKLNNVLAIKKRIEEAEKTGNIKAKVEAEEELKANKELLAKNLAGVGVDAFTNGLSQAAEAMERIADISGDVKLKQTADILNGTANVLSSTAMGAAAGGWIGALVGGLTSIMGEVTGAIMDSQVAMAQNQKAMEDYKHNMEMLALSMDESVYDTIFGESLWRKIRQTNELLKESEDALKRVQFSTYEKDYIDIDADRLYGGDSQYQKMVQELALEAINKYGKENAYRIENGRITGVYNGMKEVIQSLSDAVVVPKEGRYSTLGTMFPDLFDENGDLKADKLEDAKIALESLNNMELSVTSGRDLLSDAIDHAVKVKEYTEMLKDAAKDYMGSIGDSLGDAIVNGILKGEDALESFNDVAGGIIEQIAKDFASSWMIDNYLNTFSKDMEAAFMSGDAQDITKVVGDIVAGLPNVLEASEEATKQILDMTKGTDYDLYEKYAKEGAEGQQEASRKGYATLSEDTGNELSARALAQYESNLRIEESARAAKESIDIMAAGQVQIRDIAAESRAIIADSYLELQQIRENTASIIKPIKNLSDKMDSWNDKIMGL